jgi:hypothetical protein
MISQFLEKFNEKLNVFNNFLEKNKNLILKTLIYVFLLITFLSALGFNLFNLEDSSFFSMKKGENFFFLILEGGLLYVFNNLYLIITILINFILSLPLFLFFDYFSQSVYSFLLNLMYVFKFNGFNSLILFYDYFISKLDFDFIIFEDEYLKSKKFKKIIVINSNLPLFFYFGLLFIITTVSSLLLLSFLGLYGVFILNLMSIILF